MISRQRRHFAIALPRLLRTGFQNALRAKFFTSHPRSDSPFALNQFACHSSRALCLKLICVTFVRSRLSCEFRNKRVLKLLISNFQSNSLMCFENLSPHPFFRGPSPILRGEEVRTSLLVAYCSSILINVDILLFQQFHLPVSG